MKEMKKREMKLIIRTLVGYKLRKRHERKQCYLHNKKKKQRNIIEQKKLVNKQSSFFMNIIMKEKD